MGRRHLSDYHPDGASGWGYDYRKKNREIAPRIDSERLLRMPTEYQEWYADELRKQLGRPFGVGVSKTDCPPPSAQLFYHTFHVYWVAS